MPEPKRRDRPKGSELRASLKPKKPVRALPDRFTEQDARALPDRFTQRDIEAADMVGATDPYLSRNEFKPGFYDQKDKPPITPATMYGTASGKTMFESPIVDPDTSMMQNMAEGGSVRGQKNIQVKKKQFRGVF
jgi:hypothetical protein